ncbi:hypothetical protein WMY93_020661 [Mugilogobius chulae]|uniref:Claudin 23a n=1 Tax=Mugilogobius chulae TaxID=88201 RepID=A0AAW0NEA7_9GOBI
MVSDLRALQTHDPVVINDRQIKQLETHLCCSGQKPLLVSVSCQTLLTSHSLSCSMSNSRSQQWIRESARTPAIFIFGLVLSPCGWVLDLTSTVAPNWRTLHNLPNSPSGFTVLQGIWDICTIASETSSDYSCGQQDTAYSEHRLMEVARGLMVASLVLTLLGLAVAIPGVRCWRNDPNWTVAGVGGLLIFCSGVMTIVPVAWVGFCIVLGFIGGIMEILAGLVMFLGICRCCGGKNRGEIRVEQDEDDTSIYRDVPRRSEVNRWSEVSRPEVSRRSEVPRQSRPRREPSSVAYSRDHDYVSLPRAKSAALERGRPYDLDL